MGRRLPPTRIIERNDRLTGGSERKVGYQITFDTFAHGGSQDNDKRILL